ncbi:MAG: PhoU domain-containing protein [Methylomonas sp.]|nr:PhoU domain-containing protein [Methylomonas sp.]
MTIQSSNIKSLGPLHFFDGELGTFHGLLLETTDLLMYQMEQTLHALDYGDVDLALKVVSRDRKVDAQKMRIEAEIHGILASNLSSTTDLRIVMTLSKMADVLEKIGNEIVNLARQLQSIFDRRCGHYDAELMAEIIRIGGMIKIMLDKMTLVLETRNSNQAYKLVQFSWNCDTRLQQVLRCHLSSTLQNTVIIEHALDILHILKTLERCTGFCRHIAEHQILMLDCIDMRCRPSITEACAINNIHII